MHVVRAMRSARWPSDLVENIRARSEILEVLGGKDEGKGVLKYHELANAGHWLHVDNPVGLRDIIAPELARLHDELRGG